MDSTQDSLPQYYIFVADYFVIVVVASTITQTSYFPNIFLYNDKVNFCIVGKIVMYLLSVVTG